MRKFRFTFLMLLLLPLANYAQYTGGVGRGDASSSISGTNYFATDGNWSDVSKWYRGALPISSVIADIRADATVNGDYSYPTVIISDAGSVTISPGNSLTVTGTLTNNAATGGLVIQSTVSGTGSLITNGTIGGTGVATAQVQRYMAADAWHLISAPISDALSGMFVGQYLRPYDEANNHWDDYIVPLTTALPAGVGYVCWPVTSQAYTFTGTLNTGSISCDIAYSGSTRGNNLTGNPYPSAIDWNSLSGWTKTNLSLSVWVWNQTARNYAIWDGTNATNGGSRYIAVGQGFFVQASASSPVLSMNDNVRVHNTQAFLKNSDPENSLKLHIENPKGSDEIVVCFNPSSSWSYDPNVDSRKMFGDASAPQFYSFKPNDPEELSINVLPEIKNSLVLPVWLEAGLNGQYSISASQTESFPSNVSINLEDLKSGTAQDLRINPVYTFMADTSDIAHRFNLHFSNFPFGIPGSADDKALQIYTYEKTVYVKSDNEMNSQAQIFVYDALGRIVRKSEFSIISLSKFDLNLNRGYYIVKVLAGSGVYTQKVFID
jgi:hypothetical protein